MTNSNSIYVQKLRNDQGDLSIGIHDQNQKKEICRFRTLWETENREDLELETFSRDHNVVSSVSSNDSIQIMHRFQIDMDASLIRIKTSLLAKNHCSLDYLCDELTAVQPLESFWACYQKAKDDYVLGDAVFRSPVMFFRTGNKICALIPDLDALGTDRKHPTAMDCDYSHRTLSYGIIPYHVQGHVYFRRAKETAISISAGESIEFDYILYFADWNPKQYRSEFEPISSFFWQSFGRKNQNQFKLPTIVEKYIDYSYGWVFDRWSDITWMEFKLNRVKCGGIPFLVRIDHTLPDGKKDKEVGIWNQAWFSQARTAFGVRWFAEEQQSDFLRDKAERIINLTLQAPQSRGLFPSVYRHNEDYDFQNGHWVTSSDRRPKDHEDYFHTVDNAWTVFWLLRWYQVFEERTAILEFSTRFLDGLLEFQMGNGAIPSWIHKECFQISPFLKESAQSSMAALVFIEGYKVTQQQKYLKAAKAALDYVIDNILPTGRWEDFETYYSCAKEWEGKRLGVKDPYTDQYSQNTLSMYWTAEALKNYFLITGDEEYLAAGQRTLDEISLYQQVWDCPYLSIPTFGGFGVMNCDAEWNDARQSLFCLTYMEYYKLTGKTEYFERGRAAFQAAFVLMFCPENECAIPLYKRRRPELGETDYGFMMENYAHNGFDDGMTGDFQIYDWGGGLACTTAAMIKQDYGDLYLNLDYSQAFGINLIDVCEFVEKEDEISVRIQNHFPQERRITIIVHGLRKRLYYLSIDNRVEMEIRIDDLKRLDSR